MEKTPGEGIDDVWRAIANAPFDQVNTNAINLGGLDPVKADIYRQLAGLGLIEEASETRYTEKAYVDQSSTGRSSLRRDTVPYHVVVWKLTKRGEQHLAAIRGFKRRGEQPASS
jgi:hypothetical protein